MTAATKEKAFATNGKPLSFGGSAVGGRKEQRLLAIIFTTVMDVLVFLGVSIGFILQVFTIVTFFVRSF